MTYLPAVVIEPVHQATAAIIWLHGLGADGHDFESIVPELRLPEDCAVRFIFPHAPSIPVTINNGYVMPAWYDIKDMNLEDSYDAGQLLNSAAAAARLVDREIERGINSRRIILAGFSQGGAIAYHAALSYPEKLGGLLALSCYFHTYDSIIPAPANRDIPVLIIHGTADPVVPEALGRKSFACLQEMGYPAEYLSFSMEHSVCAEEIRAISGWMQTIL
jgi:phospholipase/carboxylesterase